MGDNKMIKGIAIGALAGAALSLFDRNTRTSTVDCLKKTGTFTKGYVKNPSDAIHDFRLKYQEWNRTLDQQVNNLVTMLDQLEGYLNKVEQLDSKQNQNEQENQQEEQQQPQQLSS